MALSFLDLMLTTAKDLRGSWVRSLLTTLGIFMGVAAVNATLNISAITSEQIQQKLAQRDNPYLVPWLRSQTDGPEPELTEEDMRLLQQEVPGIAGISYTKGIWTFSGVQYQGEGYRDVRMRGVSQNYQEITGRALVAGRFFQPSDFEDYTPVAIIDEALAARIFQGNDPLGAGIYLGGVRLTVIGVSESKRAWADQELTGELWLTRNYAEALSGVYSYPRMQIALEHLEEYEQVEEQVQAFLENRYANVTVNLGSNAEDLYQEEMQQRTSARFLLVVGILALVIGGVGIANITIAAVIERTREIGLRRAIGATDFEVMAQFIMEAIILSVVAGIGAVATVHGLTKVATTQLFEAPYQFSPRDAAISMTAALAVGVGSSFFPALRVTQIDVVQALRGE
jgi:putative ABC transport system permease protein